MTELNDSFRETETNARKKNYYFLTETRDTTVPRCNTSQLKRSTWSNRLVSQHYANGRPRAYTSVLASLQLQLVRCHLKRPKNNVKLAIRQGNLFNLIL